MPTATFWRRPASVFGPAGSVIRSAGRDTHVLALAGNLLGFLHHGIELGLGDRHETGMGDPGAVMAVTGLALLGGMDAAHRLVVGLRDRS